MLLKGAPLYNLVLAHSTSNLVSPRALAFSSHMHPYSIQSQVCCRSTFRQIIHGFLSWAQPRRDRRLTLAAQGRSRPLEFFMQAAQQGVVPVGRIEGPAPSTQTSYHYLLSSPEGSALYPLEPQQVIDCSYCGNQHMATPSQTCPSISNHIMQECPRCSTVDLPPGMIVEHVSYTPASPVPFLKYPQDYSAYATSGSLLNSTPSDPYIPLPWYGTLQTVVPQSPYVSGTKQYDWVLRSSIPFSTMGHPGVRLIDAVERRFEGMDDREGCPFDEQCNVVTIRIHV